MIEPSLTSTTTLLLFIPGTRGGPVWLSDVQCTTGSETSLLQCSRGGWGCPLCVHTDLGEFGDVMVVCSNTPSGGCLDAWWDGYPNHVMVLNHA